MDTKDKESGVLNNDFKARRRLLKASAAAPLIATLSPNVALAQGSLTCATKGLGDAALQNLQQSPPVGRPVSDEDDNAVRVLGTCWKKKNQPDIWEVPKGTFYSSDGGPLDPSFGTNDQYKASPCYFLEFVTVLGDGSVLRPGTYYPQPATGDVLADSCLTSITAAGRFTIG